MRTFSLALVAAFFTATTFLACKDTYVDPTVDQFGRDTTAIRQFVRTQSGVTYQPAAIGVQYAITKANPAGRLPAAGDEIELNYLLSSLDGRFRADSALKDSVAYWRFNAGTLPSGFDVGLSRTREGESATYLIPSYAGFQDRSFVNIPANTPLRLNVTVRKLRTEEEQITDYIARQKLTVTTTTPEGVRISKTQSVSAGAELTNGQTVSLRYTGRFLRYNRVFDSNVNQTPARPLFDVTLGSNVVVRGFEAGVRALKVGEKAVVVLPSSQGYGTRGTSDGTIPPNTPLAFEIEVVSVR